MSYGSKPPLEKNIMKFNGYSSRRLYTDNVYGQCASKNIQEARKYVVWLACNLMNLLIPCRSSTMEQVVALPSCTPLLEERCCVVCLVLTHTQSKLGQQFVIP